MKIVDVETLQLRLPVVRDIGDGTQDVLILRVHTDEGHVGIGEVHTSPSVAQQVIDAPLSHVKSRGLRDVLVGHNPLEINPLWHRMYQATAVYGRRGIAIHTISGIDLALWDLLGKVTDLPVASLLGGSFRSKVQPYASVLMPETVQGTEELTRRCLDEGFSAVKFGWGTLGSDISDDARRIEAARRVAPDAELMIDVGYGLPLDRALALAHALAPFGLSFIEEPLDPDDIRGFRWLSERSPIPVATGEKESTRHGFDQLLEHGRPHVVQPDLARAGGFSETRIIADRAEAAGVRCIPHCWSTDVLVASTLHFIASRREEVRLEFCLEGNDLRRNVARSPITMVDGAVHVPEGSGLGIELNEDTIQRYCVKRTTGTARS